MVALGDPQELVGAVLNRTWKLVRVIGQGGLGLVYEATHQTTPGAWAIKLLQHEFVEEETTVARFLSEAEAAARLTHPGIVRVFEAQRAEDGTPYLVMELLQGQSLHAAMNAGRLDAARSIGICRQLLEALDSVHRVGVIHRDVKPENVFLTSGDQVKLLDLGLARVMDAAGGMSRKTKTGMMLGTPGYMSPEQIKNVKESDLRSDLWAVGVILYELLSGRQAFGAATEFARMTAALTEDVAPLSQVAPQLPGWDGFFARALAKEPIERFQTASEMLAALEEQASGAGAPSRGPAQTSASPAVAAAPPAQSQVSPTQPEHPSLVAFPPTDTRVSADNPAPSGMGHDRHAPPSIAVVSNKPEPLRVAWWAALLMALACLLAGVVIGVLLGRA